ncbi:MAG: hypothetical protein KIT60_02185 [Burkholderiaceae bacterium]|nr:hypothetical protein [Burkholderiaceae bacterium]
MNPIFSTAGVTLAALMAACAQTPSAHDVQTAALDCAAIEAQIDTAADAQRAAAQLQHDAWKAVVPFAVMARYGRAKAAANESQQRLDALRQQAALRGCAIPTL